MTFTACNFGPTTWSQKITLKPLQLCCGYWHWLFPGQIPKPLVSVNHFYKQIYTVYIQYSPGFKIVEFLFKLTVKLTYYPTLTFKKCLHNSVSLKNLITGNDAQSCMCPLTAQQWCCYDPVVKCTYEPLSAVTWTSPMTWIDYWHCWLDVTAAALSVALCSWVMQEISSWNHARWLVTVIIMWW